MNFTLFEPDIVTDELQGPGRKKMQREVSHDLPGIHVLIIIVCQWAVARVVLMGAMFLPAESCSRDDHQSSGLQHIEHGVKGLGQTVVVFQHFG